MPISEVIIGASLGVGLQVLQNAIKRAKERSIATRFILNRLKDTITCITPLVAQIDKRSKVEDSSLREVNESLKLHLGKAASLVEGYAQLRLIDFCKKYRYWKNIIELEATLRWMVDVDVQVNQWADIKELKAKISEINTKLDEITRQPSDCICFKSNHTTSQSTSQDIVGETDPSSEKIGECSNDGSKPKIDIHIGWSSRTRNKNHEIRFVWK